MDGSMPGFPVPHCLPEFVWIHVHEADDAITIVASPHI